MRRAISWTLTLLFLFALSPLTSNASAHDGESEMTGTVRRILSTLNESQREACVFEFDSQRRKAWNFVPDKFIQPEGQRFGLVMSDMTSQQRLLTHALLNSVLSSEGYRQTVTIMNLEQVLHELENSNPIRDPQRYYLSIYGSPDDQVWGWRFEGHHLSLNFTVKDGQLVAPTPSFFGTNPAEVREGNMKGLKTLRAEEELARELLASLNEQQRAKAIAGAEAPADILTGNQAEVKLTQLLPSAEAGITAADLNDQQKELLQKIVDEFMKTYQRPAIDLPTAQSIVNSKTRFVWLGGTEAGQGHYYRIQTEDFVMEYDNTQNNANHVHLVWRDIDNDFGANWLQDHLDQGHSR